MAAAEASTDRRDRSTALGSQTIVAASKVGGQPHLVFMDGVRGIAVLLVLVYHLKEALAVDLSVHAGPVAVGINHLAQVGFLGVEVFFFISGFVLFYPYARSLFEDKPLPTVAHFANRRALKILPSYVFSLVFMTLVLAFSAPPTANLFRDFLLHLGFVHNYNYTAFFSLNGPLWSLAIEVQFYLLFPFIAWAFRHSPLVTFLGMTALASAYRLHLALHGGSGDSYYIDQLPGFLDTFAFGIGTAYVIVMCRASWPELARFRPAFTLLSIGAALGLNAMFARLAMVNAGPPTWEWQNLHRLELNALVALFCFTGMLASGAWQRLIGNRALVFCALISYNLYLWNKFVILWVRHAVLPWTRGWWDPGLTGGLLVIVCCIGVAIAATYLIERPFLLNGWSVLTRPVAWLMRAQPQPSVAESVAPPPSRRTP